MDTRDGSPAYQDASSRASSIRPRPETPDLEHRPTKHQLSQANNSDTDIPESSFIDAESQSKGRSKSKTAGASNSAGNASQFSVVGKIRHLKKEDGEPLWRKDIQYDFLKAVFDNDQPVFTNRYEPAHQAKQNFADLYIDTMARSSKTSKVLRDKLLSDREAAKGMAMVCLLVNVGRMNTTLNFFPEMRAQLRTYHAIPSLQAHQDASAYKQLQDAPRLKSILKGAAEDTPEPHVLAEFKDLKVPRTNPVNLIFLICQQATQVAELHFPSNGEFHDVIMKTNYTSESRANAFLWLMWFYLESDFTEEGCEENPFGAGVDYGTEVANQGVPTMVEMTEEQEALENNDPPEEVEFGREKQAHRAKIIAADQLYLVDNQNKRGSRGRVAPGEDGPTAAILPRIRPSKHESDMDSTRSTPPPRALGRIAGSTGRRGGAALKYQIYQEGSSPAGHGSHGIDGILPRKPRPPTAHQLAVERNRNQRVEYILDRGLRREHHRARKIRRQEGAIVRARRRLEALLDPLLDSDDEEFRGSVTEKFRSRALGGLAPLIVEVDDFGEQFASYAAALRRCNRRLGRWGSYKDAVVVAPIKRQGKNGDSQDSKGHADLDLGKRTSSGRGKSSGGANGDHPAGEGDDLDDMDKELLGLASGGEGEGDGDGDERANGQAGPHGDDGKDDDEELDDVDKTLLGMDDDDDDEMSDA